jgi:hypothetical protein
VSDDPFQGEEWAGFAEHVIVELIPKIDQSAIAISLVPGGNKTDVKFAVELGFMIMLDKPIIAVVAPGAKVPRKLAKVADEIVEGDLDDENMQKRLHAAIDRTIKKAQRTKKDG